MNKPLVSISCLVFNHAPYLRQCLDGFMMQKTDFTFEVLIHDDASTDGSADIIREYESKYPDIVKPIYETENQWKHGRRGSAVFNFPRAQGKYIALCEGDDYWTDPLKLQKQVDFLESHPDYSMCFHNAMNQYEGQNRPMEQFSSIENKEYFIEDLLNYWMIPTASVVFRTEVVRSELYKTVTDANLMFGDTPLFLTCVREGRIMGFSETMSIYRRTSSGVSSGFSTETYHRLVEYHEKLGELFGHEDISHQAVVRTCVDGFIYSLTTKKVQIDFSFFRKAVQVDARYLVHVLFQRINGKKKKVSLL